MGQVGARALFVTCQGSSEGMRDRINNFQRDVQGVGVLRVSVCCECCVLLGRGLYVELITCPEESYRLCVITKHREWESPEPLEAVAPTGRSYVMKMGEGRNCFRIT
jgi:hypothetical protein